jgi:hypothetical protein
LAWRRQFSYRAAMSLLFSAISWGDFRCFGAVCAESGAAMAEINNIETTDTDNRAIMKISPDRKASQE